ncbi:hypothetical protein ABENE_20215 [Asticcacaulis benevestitus DSM 16100 = ATCC BAA-896]|uniref:TonB-denpendent receptor n=1 Tax=Asticcacaulis benevestitus DSM 16100 = ATCC BAA-896 TaxID=1121022 RepID=V4P987_9CAUL|nr:hypothetical protein ABENE_20215 [Asticcacaulis benevestitus DSM 16100 = ATCC BAA-896]
MVPADQTEATFVVVTGSARPQRRFDVSYAVNSLSAEAIQKLAPKSYADLMGSVPGIQVETTGGEAQNVTRLRGIPGDRFGMIVQQDGLALYPQSDGFFFNSGEGMNRFDLMTQRVEIVRGGPAPIYGSGASAIINNITVTGSAQTKGEAQLTLGDTGLYRADVYQSGALSKDTFYAVGGFLRYNDGYRNNGFPNDKGGQIRGNIKHNLDNGWVKVSAQYLDDINVFYLPIPVADPRNPSVSLDPYLDYFTGTMNSPAFRAVNIKYYDQNGVLQSQQRDLANGRHMKFGNVGLQYEGDFNGTTIKFNSSLTKGQLSFDALYSTSNPVDGASYAGSQLTAARSAFGSSVDHLGYTLAGTGGATVYSPSADSGLVVQGQYRAVDSDFYSFETELSATHTFDTTWGSHDVKGGVNAAFWGLDSFAAYQDYLMQVKSQPKTLDLVAYSSTGAILGNMTENGALHDTTTLNRSNLDAKLLAFYVNDTWSIADKLRLDAGVRQESYTYTGYQLATASKPVPGSSVAASFARGFTGQSIPINVHLTATNWTAGVNYDFSSHFGMYGRASELTAPALLSSYVTYPLGSTIASKADQYEVGLKASFGKSYLYATGFYTHFNPLNASFTAFNPQTGATTNVPFIGTAVESGVEIDGQWRPSKMFSISGSLTVSRPEYRDFASTTGASASAILGKQIVREPKIMGHIEPTFDFDLGSETNLEAYVGYEYVGERFVDVLNTTALPAYGTVRAGATFTHADWKLQLVGDNLTNAKGLTEGNTRTDTLSGQGTPTAIYGRPLFGRSFRVIASRKW